MTRRSEMPARATLVALVGFSAVSTDLYLSGIPGMARDLGVTRADGQLTLSVFLIGFTLGQLLAGPPADYYGRKPVIFVGVAIYVLASLICALAPSIDVLLGGRMLQGLAAATGPVVARAMVRDSYRGVEAARIMSLLAAAMAVVPLVAPVLGSWLLYFFDWRAQFWLLTGFGLLVLWGWRSLEESCPSIGRDRPDFLATLRQFGPCFANRRFLLLTLCGSAVFACMFAYISSASFIVIELLGTRPQYFGYTFMLAALGYMSGSFLSARLVPYIGSLPTIGIGLTVGLCGASVLTVCAVSDRPSLAAVIPAVFCCFACTGLSLPNSQMEAISQFPRSAGRASAVFGFVQTGIGSCASLIVARGYDGSLRPTAFTMIGAIVLAITAWTLLRRQPSPYAET